MILGIVATSRPADPSAAPRERHPHIRGAINELREGSEEVRTGATDFCGHKVASMRAVEAAQRQLQLALKRDRH